MKKGLVIGSINLDITINLESFPKKGETVLGKNISESCGGKGANQAVALSRSGIYTKFIGAVGSDNYGKILEDKLKKNKIATLLKKYETNSGVAILTVDNNGDNNIVVIPGANEKLSINDIDNNYKEILDVDIVVFQNEIALDVIDYSLKSCKKMGKITVFNPAPAKVIPNELFTYVDYLILNETEFEFIFKISVNDYDFENKVINKKIEYNISNIIITLGEKGSLAVDVNNKIYKYVAKKVKVINTTGAGDCFIGAFCSQIIDGKSLNDSINYATVASAISVTKLGAQDSIPFKKEVLDSLKNEEENVNEK